MPKNIAVRADVYTIHLIINILRAAMFYENYAETMPLLCRHEADLRSRR